MRSFRTAKQLFVCYRGQQKGKAVSKQRMSHWIVDTITLAYQKQGLPCLLKLKAHSTRSIASSWALACSALLTDTCRAAGWATPNIFTRFFSVCVEFPLVFSPLTGRGTDTPLLGVGLQRHYGATLMPKILYCRIWYFLQRPWQSFVAESVMPAFHHLLKTYVKAWCPYERPPGDPICVMSVE